MIEAHGLGGQSDLPIPLSLTVGGAVAALVISFSVLILAWRTPRFGTGDRALGRPVPSVVSRAILSPYAQVALRAIGFALFLFAVTCALLGKEQLTNPFFGIVYVWWWVGLVFASLILGPVWRAISPVRTINAALGALTGGPTGIREYPAWLGHWPAALGLFAFVWLELVYENSSELSAVRLWCALYVAIMLVGGAVFGPRFYEMADPFEVYSTLASRLSPWALAESGGEKRVVVRNPFANLAATPPRPGLVAVVAVLFGSTAYDSFGESPFWIQTVYGSSLTANTLNNLALAGFCVGVGLLFAAGCMLTGVGQETRRLDLPRLLAHAIAPIIVGYIVAHYLTLFVDYGLQTLALASDPLGRGWDLFGTASLAPSYWFSYHPTLLASIKVLAVVIGHVAAAVAVHDRAIGILPRRHQVTGQLPLLVTMVAFTAGGLYLLFAA